MCKMLTFTHPLPSPASPLSVTGRAPPSPGAARRCVHWLGLWLLGLVLALPLGSQAEPQKGSGPAALIESARKQMDGVRTTLRGKADDATLIDVRRRAQEVQAQAEQAAGALAGELAEVKARVAELGEPADDVKEPADIAAQRTQLVKAQSALDSQVRLARLLSVEAEQAAASVGAQRRSQFSAQLLERTPAITSAQFWRELISEAPSDLERAGGLIGELRAAIATIPMGIWWLAAFAIALVLLAVKPLKQLMRHLVTTRVPPGRLRRSLHAVGTLLLRTLTPGLIAHTLYLVLTSGADLSAPLRGLLAGFDGIVWLAGFTVGLGSALFMPGKPSWRLPPITDTTAYRLRRFPLALACGMVLGWVTTQLYSSAEASLATMVALKTLTSVTLLLTMVGALMQLRGSRRAPAEPGSPPVAAPLWLPTLSSFAWLLLGVTLLGLVSGYVALGSFVINQVVWALIVLSTAYLLAMLIDDLFMTLLAPTALPSDPSSAPEAQPGGQPGPAAPRTREQTAVLLSGACRVGLLLLAAMLLLAPFGEGPMELFRRAGEINEGLSIGEIHLRPVTLVQGLAVLVIGLFAVRRMKKWLNERLMPTTRMDSGMRMSVATLFGYGGAITVVAVAMSAVGVGLERVAWVASALSVGIGFGLQAVVQNFVSGLILLAERPVKVGDWVSLGGVEGDIRRINVRATEIQMGDRSTVIVPNSEFITKIVRNVTYTDPIGMVQIKLPMPLSTDTRKARAVLLDAVLAHPGVLDSPAPNVQLDGIDGARMLFNATGFVKSPRAASGVKSDLLFEVLEKLRDAGLDLAPPPTTMVLSSPLAPALRPPEASNDETPPRPPAA
jgi:potassium efflux system protein